MKYSKLLFFVYALCAVKIVATFLFLTGPIVHISIISIVLSIALVFRDDNLGAFSVFLLLITSAVWCSLTLFSLLGTFVKKLRAASVYLIVVANSIDVICACFVDHIGYKIVSICLSAVILLLSVKVICDNKRERIS